MEGRKLQKVGYSTLAVSLPSQWVKQAGLRKGDTVFCSIEKDGSLRLIPIGLAEEKPKRHVAVNMDLCGERKLLERLIVGCYIMGCDAVTIFSHGKIRGEWLSAIRKAAFRLAGLSIIDEKPNTVTLQCAIDPSSIPLLTMIRRLFALTLTMYSEVLEALSTLNPNPAKEVINREYEADMLYWLILRIIIIAHRNPKIAEKIGVQELRHLIGYRIIIKYLEAVGDHLEEVARHLLTLTRLKARPSKPTVKRLHLIGEKSLEIFSNAFESLITNSLRKAHQTVEEKEAFESEEEKIFGEILGETREPEVAVHLGIVSNAFRRISDYGASIAHMTINMYLDRPSRLVKPLKQESF